MLRNLLLYRLIIVDLLGLILIGYAYSQGWVQRVIANDDTGIIWAVVALFLIFQVSLFIRATKVAAILNATKGGEASAVDGEKFLAKSAHLNKLPEWMMFVGLIGNTVGIMLSMQSAGEMIAGGGGIEALLGSLGVAFSATIASGVLAIWAEMQSRMLETATVLMIRDANGAGDTLGILGGSAP